MAVIENCHTCIFSLFDFSVMNLIERNQFRIKKLVVESLELAKQVDSLDWEELRLALEQCVLNEEQSIAPEEYSPASYYPLIPENTDQEELYARAFNHGESIIRAGKTAAFTVAGGQGTRLGYDGPKGTLPFTPIK